MAQMYDHELNPVKGWWDAHALDKSANLATGETFVAGQVVSLNSSAEFVKGLSAAGAMPVFVLQNSTDFDTGASFADTNAYNGAGGRYEMDSGFGPAGGVRIVSGLVATGGYELESTEYDAGGTYAPNTPLTTGANAGTNAGNLIPGTFYADTIVGVCSAAPRTNEHGKSVLAFWSYFLPPIDFTDGSVSDTTPVNP